LLLHAVLYSTKWPYQLSSFGSLITSFASAF
jgi:hypothetical protein